MLFRSNPSLLVPVEDVIRLLDIFWLLFQKTPNPVLSNMLWRSNFNLLVQEEDVIRLLDIKWHQNWKFLILYYLTFCFAVALACHFVSWGPNDFKLKKGYNLEISNMLFRSNPNLLVEVEDSISLVGDQVEISKKIRNLEISNMFRSNPSHLFRKKVKKIL
jgi:hypothetical protein